VSQVSSQSQSLGRQRGQGFSDFMDLVLMLLLLWTVLWGAGIHDLASLKALVIQAIESSG